MYYNHMTLSDGTVIFPAYLDIKARMQLKEKIKKENLMLYCGCGLLTQSKLPYNISTDGRFIPAHHKYEHSPLCARNTSNTKRASAYLTEENGTVKAFLNFDLTKFSIPKISDEQKDDSAQAEKPSKKVPSPENNKEENNQQKKDDKESIKEPLDSLGQFVLNLNTDTYRERLAEGKGMLSADYFLPTVIKRLKKVYIDGIRKPLGELRVNEDDVAFFYQPVLEVQTGDYNCITLKGYKSNVSHFMFKGTMQKEKALFEKRYGISLEEAMQNYNVMAAGFVYRRLSQKMTSYKVIGRIHFFIINKNGLYCREQNEVKELDLISDFLREKYRYKMVQFERVTDDKRIFGIFTKPGKRKVIVCKPKIEKSMKPETSEYIAYATKELCAEDMILLAKLID